MTSTSISKAERSYIQAGLLANPPRRANGRSLHDFRTISLETGVAPLSNGSARLSIGQNLHEGSGGTEIMASVKLEVENIEENATDGGRIACSVSWYVRSCYFNIPLNIKKTVLLQHILIFHLELWTTISTILPLSYTRRCRIHLYSLKISV